VPRKKKEVATMSGEPFPEDVGVSDQPRALVETLVVPPAPVGSTLPAGDRRDHPGERPFVKFGPFPTNERNTTMGASIWRRNVTLEGGEVVTVYSAALTRTYFDKDGVPRSSNSIRASEIPLAILLLEKCDRHIKDLRGNGNTPE
jgi:hypothetical protein